MTAARAARLVRLYPQGWREKYGTEFVALLERERMDVPVLINVGAGALDAWVSPKKWIHDPVEANAYTLRFWRVPMPTQGRSVTRELLLSLGVVVAIKAAGDVIAWMSGDGTVRRITDVAAVPVAATVVTVTVWLREFSWRTKAVATAFTSTFSFSVLAAIAWVMG